jgi:hypothetical protein
MSTDNYTAMSTDNYTTGCIYVLVSSKGLCFRFELYISRDKYQCDSLHRKKEFTPTSVDDCLCKLSILQLFNVFVFLYFCMHDTIEGHFVAIVR